MSSIQSSKPDTKKLDIRSFINSPWVCLSVPLLLGGFWLVLHPELIMNNLNKPYALLAGPCLVGSVLLGWFVLRFFAAIERGCKLAVSAFLQARKDDGAGQFFWIVIAVFLGVSVFASGSFFSVLERDALPGLGYATALFIDLVAVNAMKARLNAVRMRDRAGAFLYLLGVLVCAGASAFANVYTSLQTFTAPAVGSPAAGGLPAWMITVAPWFGLVFPVLIVLLSMTADYTIDQSSGRLEPEKYRTQEEKRVKILEIQRDMLRTRVTVEREIDQLTTSLKRKDSGRVFFLVAWFFPKQKQASIQPVLDGLAVLTSQYADLKAENERLTRQVQGLQSPEPIDLTGLTSGIVTQLESLYAGRFETLTGQVKALQSIEPLDLASLTSGIVTRLEESYAAKFDALTEQVEALQAGRGDEIEQEESNASGLAADMQALLVVYPGLTRWLESGQRSASDVEIVEVTGHTPKMIANRCKDRFAKTSRKGVYRLSSVVDWLKTAPVPRGRDTDSLVALKSSSNGHSQASVSSEQLEEVTV